MSDDFTNNINIDNVDEVERQLLAEDREFILNKVGSTDNTMLTIMRDHFGGGWFGVIWEFAPEEETPIGTIRPFERLKDVLEWMYQIEELGDR